MMTYLFSLIKLIAINLIITLFILPGWILKYLGATNFDQIWFTINNAQGGNNLTPVIDYFIDNGIIYLSVLFVYCLPLILKRIFKTKTDKVFNLNIYGLSLNFSTLIFSNSSKLFLIFVLLLTSSYSFYKNLHIDDYIARQSITTTIYEDEYVHPKNVSVTFNGEKRNFIHIVLESMEDTFSRYNLDGTQVDLIPNLTKIAKENFTFTQDSISSYTYSDRFINTISSLVGLTAGNVINVPVDRNNLGDNGTFFPGSITFGEILEDHGYNNYFYMGSDKAFADRDVYYTTHGNYDIFDYTRAIEENYIPDDYKVYWGFEDLKLFEFAKEKLTEISQNDAPFNFKLLTVDTHFPDGYLDSTCPQLFDHKYANAIYCSDMKVGAFVSWIQQQDFYDNTTILITGDHMSMNAEFVKDQENRTLYHTIINGVDLGDNTNRAFTVVDWFPTSLHLVGATIEGDRLGFGTNVFSEFLTLTEEFGNEIYMETAKRSDYYTNNILKKPKE